MKGPSQDPERRLDELLDRAGDVETPANLAGDLKRKLAQVAADERLDRVLDELPEPSVPEGLARRVREGLEQERKRSTAPQTGFQLGAFRAFLAAAAIVVLFGVIVWSRRGQGAGDAVEIAQNNPEDRVEPGPSEEVPEEELLAVIDALENWDLLTSDDVELLLASLDVADETLLQLDAETSEPTGGSLDSKNGETKKG